MTLVKWTEDMQKWVNDHPGLYTCEMDFPLLYLGEIRNMKEHGVFVGQSGEMYTGLHIENFEELSEDEI